ncbi:flagellar protein FlhE [Pseudocitrobacter cyperus]|uniref:Flagellar protein FlhE n=1 Tax=Pseudocitrobacter cyperus TaxID=3112843 RepID=A0ABV0HD34_9ENTR
MIKYLLLFCLSFTVHAAGEGAWQASRAGLTLNHRGESVSSAPLRATGPVTGAMTLVAWRYELNGPIPAGLRTRLCSSSRCVEIDSQSGTTHAFAHVSAAESLRFIWEVPGGGRLIPALQVRRIAVIVNYR